MMCHDSDLYGQSLAIRLSTGMDELEYQMSGTIKARVVHKMDTSSVLLICPRTSSLHYLDVASVFPFNKAG